MGTFRGSPERRRRLAVDLREFASMFGGFITRVAIERVAGIRADAAAHRFVRLRRFFDRARVPYVYEREDRVAGRDGQGHGGLAIGAAALKVEPGILIRLAERLEHDAQEGICFFCGKGRDRELRQRPVACIDCGTPRPGRPPPARCKVCRLERLKERGVSTTHGRGERERLPKRREDGRNYEVDLGKGIKLYVTLNYYPDGRLGEMFIDMVKQGSTLRTSLHVWATMLSKALQFGMPAREVVRTFRDVACAPTGTVKDDGTLPDSIGGVQASSIWDAIARLIEGEVGEDGRRVEGGEARGFEGT